MKRFLYTNTRAHLSGKLATLSFSALLFLLIPDVLLAQKSAISPNPTWADDPPALSTLVDFAQTESKLRVAIERYLQDQAAIERRYPVQYSPVRHERLRTFYTGWQQALAQLNFNVLNPEGQIDYIALRNRITFDREMLQQTIIRGEEMVPLLPFSNTLRQLQETRYDRQRVDPQSAASTLDETAREINRLTLTLEVESRQPREQTERPDISKTIAARAANQVEHLRDVLKDWNTFYDGYDPLFSWWVRQPYAALDEALAGYADAINRFLVGRQAGSPPPLIGDPVLAEGLRAHLAVEMIPYSAEELIEIGEQEFAWIERAFKEVSHEMGFGEDWKAALEHTKNLAPPPGEKPWVIFDIAAYSENFIDSLGSVTMPPLAREVWRLEMQSPQQQLVNPFFTGGEVTRVSYPTDGMSHQDKLMSMRGNTPHFNFATVHHELIPGHHLQGFMSRRFNTHRSALNRTPFWLEGWALYWELQLWDQDFPRNNPDKIGMLFWRLHRAARIIFSLNYQLGNWTPQEAVDFLVDRVGHERANAEAEVRRTARDAPLYQIAYLTGGLQFRALYRELVESGQMTAQEFHDAIMLGGRMPVELVRARLTGQQLTPDYQSQWRFYQPPVDND